MDETEDSDATQALESLTTKRRMDEEPLGSLSVQLDKLSSSTDRLVEEMKATRGKVAASRRALGDACLSALATTLHS